MIVLLHDLDMVIVVTSDPFYRPIREDHEAWTHEQANFNLIGKFLLTLEGVPEVSVGDGRDLNSPVGGWAPTRRRRRW